MIGKIDKGAHVLIIWIREVIKEELGSLEKEMQKDLNEIRY